MPIFDFRCDRCGHLEEDLFYRTPPKRRKCPKCCQRGAMQQWFGAKRRAQINYYSSQLYGRYHVQAGEVIRDYGHKRELMKRYGWTEAGDPVNGNRKLSEEEMHAEETQGEPTTEGMEWGDPAEMKETVERLRLRGADNLGAISRVA